MKLFFVTYSNEPDHLERGNIMWNEEYVNELKKRREKSFMPGGQERIDKQHAKGKLTARERINQLVDKDSFVEIAGFQISDVPIEGVHNEDYPGDGVVTGYGLINGRQVFISSQDFTVMGGTISKGNSRKICQIIQLAINHKAPYISLNDSGGARIDEGIYALDACSAILHANVMASGVIPQIAVILGPCAGVSSYSPALMDFIIIQRDNGQMYLTGPDVVKAAIGETATAADLGGAAVHMEQSGLAHFCYADDMPRQGKGAPGLPSPELRHPALLEGVCGYRLFGSAGKAGSRQYAQALRCQVRDPVHCGRRSVP